jgi:protein gp37
LPSKIEWTDETWNPVVGCTRVSPGCGLAMFPGDQPGRCYAIGEANRHRNLPAYEGVVERTGHGLDWTGRVNCLPERLPIPFGWRRPRLIFVNSMSDLFHKGVPEEFIARVFAVAAATPDHTYQVLTKQDARMLALLTRGGDDFADMVERAMPEFTHAGLDNWPLPNVWLGVSVERQQEARRVLRLLETPAATRFVSAEPLLGPLDLRNIEARGGSLVDCLGGDVKAGADGPVYCDAPNVVDLVIAGGQSGPGAHPADPAWFRWLRDDSAATGTAFQFKQWGNWIPTGKLGRGGPLPGHAFVGEPVDEHGFRIEMHRVHKKVAGRELDGRTWDESPPRRTRDDFRR